MEKIKIGLIAEDRVAELHYLAHKESKISEVYGVYSSDKEFIKSFDCRKYDNYQNLINDKEIDAVEIVANLPLSYKLAIDALNKNKNVSLESPFAGNLKQVDELIQTAKNKNLKLHLCTPSLFYPPYCEAKKLIDEEKIGGVQAIRIKSNIGATGGWKINFEREQIIFKEIYEKLALSYFLLGDIEKIFSFGMMSEDNFSPAIIMWKYKEPCKYGILEVVFSKEMFIQSKYYHQDENIEISGTSGYIWITKQKANMQNTPSVLLYRRDRLYTYEDLRDDWLDAFIDCSLQFVDYICGKKSAIPYLNDAKKILRWTLAAKESHSEQKEILL